MTCLKNKHNTWEPLWYRDTSLRGSKSENAKTTNLRPRKSQTKHVTKFITRKKVWLYSWFPAYKNQTYRSARMWPVSSRVSKVDVTVTWKSVPFTIGIATLTQSLHSISESTSNALRSVTKWPLIALYFCGNET